LTASGFSFHSLVHPIWLFVMTRFGRLSLTVALALGALPSAAVLAQVRLPPPGSRADSGGLGRSFGVVDGIVADTNLAPLQGAFVSILGTKIRVGTGPNGRFRITKVPAGQYLVIVKRVGYRPTSGVVDVAAQDTVRLSYTLEQVVTELSPVTITERPTSLKLADFLARKKLGIGQFMTAEQIDAQNSVYPTELFRRFNGINVSPNRGRQLTEYFALSMREGGNPQTGACPMAVILDDVPLPTPFNLDLLPPPRDLAGIEIYAGSSTTPARYNGFNRGCGVILVWTKDF
jgi:Carboxypeptidase regulatory-like domain